MSQGDPQKYSFAADHDGEYAVFLAASQDVGLIVVDSQHQQLVAQLVANPATGPLLENSTQDFPATQGTVLLLTIAVQQSNASFQLQVYAVKPAPEQRPAQFSIGDTVAGEAISPVADVDNFWTHGTAGQQIVVVPQPLASTGAGALLLLVSDSSSNAVISFSGNDASTSPPQTSGRFRLPFTDAYRFQLRGVQGVNSHVAPRYEGSYRFWSYTIDPAPEHRSAILPVGAVVSGERVDRAGDVDEFTFQAAAGTQYNAFVQGSRQVQLEVAPDSGPALAAMLSSATDTGLFSVATGRFTLLQAGAYLVRVFGAASYDLADTSSYRLMLYPIDSRPEHIGAAVTLGDTVSGESIDRPGDIDEFPFPGVAGDEFNVFFQVLTGSAVPLQLTVADSLGLAVGLVQSRDGDTSLSGQFTGRFTLPAGPERIHVEGIGSNTALDTGAYRFRVVRINRAPEALADTVAFGDSLFGERIDLPGDVDEFRVSIPDSSGANLVAEFDSGTSGASLEATLLDSTGRIVADARSFSPGGFAQSGTLLPGPGKYTLRVQGADNPSAFVGPYRVWLYKFRFGPEIAPDTIAIGDTITGEALDPPGDIDVFSFFGQRGDHINIALQGLGVPGNGAFLAMLSASGQPPFSFVVSPMLADSLGAYQSNRVDLAQTGWYQLRISGGSTPTLFSERGPYHFAITRWSTSPEHVGAALAPGDSVTGEAMDYPWDWDEFTVTGAAGQMLAVVSRTLSGSGNPSLMVFDSSTGDTLARAVVQDFDQSSGRFVLPASGRAQIAVFTSTFVGDYRLVVVPVNPAPENVPATFAVGDTVRGEAIFPATDLDEFSATATPLATLAPWWRLTADPVPAGGLMSLQVVDPATGTVLVGSNVSIFASSPTFFTPGQFTVPASGNFVVRVRAYYENDVTTAPYEFYVAPVP